MAPHHEQRKVAILLAEQYEDLEFWYPYYRLKEAGAAVTAVAAKGGQTYPSKHGYPARSDVAAGDVRGDAFDAVVIPGGFAPDFMRRDAGIMAFAKQAAGAGVPMAAICHGVWILASADALRNRTATSFYAIADDVRNAGATWVDRDVVVDHNLITSRCPDDLPAFCREILGKLGL